MHRFYYHLNNVVNLDLKFIISKFFCYVWCDLRDLFELKNITLQMKFVTW